MSCQQCQQFEVYAAEGGVPPGRVFHSSREMQDWVDNLREEPWWERFYPQVLRVEAVFGRGPGSVGGWFKDRGSGRCEMAPPHRCELVVCHELAHVLADARFGSQAHCPWWAKVYLELVYATMGTEPWTALRDAFVRDGIEFNPDPEPFEIGRRIELGAATCA
jgi:putative metallohydrolase (TIGR04338 family)